ncbi:unnamed protein product [Closterium sp. NIES-65]|nr:unnamed protein product [Closterium sp. NIES-65]
MTTTPTTLISRPSPPLLNVKVPTGTSSRPLPLPATPTTLPTTPPTRISRPTPPSLYEGSTWTSSHPHTGQGIDDVTPEMLEDCAQLVKANSIMGNKLNNIDVVYTPLANLCNKLSNIDEVYTPWANLHVPSWMYLPPPSLCEAMGGHGRPGEDMGGQVGQVRPGEARGGQVRCGPDEIWKRVAMRNVDVVYTPWANLRKAASMDVGQKEAREVEDRAARKAVLREQARREQEEKALSSGRWSYGVNKGIMVEKKMTPNKDTAAKMERKSVQDVSDDFM